MGIFFSGNSVYTAILTQTSYIYLVDNKISLLIL